MEDDTDVEDGRVNRKLRAARLNKQWSQGRLAGEMGVDESTVQRWETYRSFPNPYQRGSLCRRLSKNPSQPLKFEELGLIEDDYKRYKPVSRNKKQPVPSDDITLPEEEEVKKNDNPDVDPKSVQKSPPIFSSPSRNQAFRRRITRPLSLGAMVGLALLILFSIIILSTFWHPFMPVPVNTSTPSADATPSILRTRVHVIVLNEDQPVLCIECQYSGLIVLITGIGVDGDHNRATVTLQFTNKTANSFGVQLTLSLTDKNGNSYHLVLGTADPFSMEAHSIMIIKPEFEFISTSSNTYTLNIVVTDNDNLWRNNYLSHPTVPTLLSSTI